MHLNSVVDFGLHRHIQTVLVSVFVDPFSLDLVSRDNDSSRHQWRLARRTSYDFSLSGSVM